MTHRTFHIGASFAIVLVAYCAYALLAVPWIETSVKVVDLTNPTGGHPPPETPPPDALNVLFGPNDWELHDAKVISSNDQALLLWKSYAIDPRAKDWVELNPLTVVFIPSSSVADPAERLRHAVVMQVPGGAKLHFDRPIDLKHTASMGRLVEGQLRGQVKIRSRGKRPDHQDDLLVLTRDVELTEQQIKTANPVEFSFGPNWGRGRQMEIRLLKRLGPQAGSQEGPNVGGIESVQLEHVERLHLEMSQPATPTTAAATGQSPSGPLLPGALSSQAGPVEITCLGPFRFHFVDQVATFRDHVSVEQSHPNGPSDQLNCDVLSVHFLRPDQQSAAKGKPSAPGFDLQPSQIEAQGSPAVLNSPIEHFQARAGTLEYNLISGQVYLKDGHEVTLLKDHNEIHATSLRYVPDPQGRRSMDQLLAGGPGWLRGEMADRPGEQLEARWQSKLEVRPQDQKQVISLTGGAALKFQAMGRLDADEVHLRLREVAGDATNGSAAKQSNFEPDQLLAIGNVVGDSPQFSLRKMERLDVWFTTERLPAASASGVAATGFSVAGRGAAPPPGYVPSTIAGLPPPPATPSTNTSPLSQSTPQGPPAVAARQSHWELSGRQLQARVVLRDQQHGDLTEVTVVESVSVRETETEKPGEQPLVITGDWLHATDANTLQAKVTVVGKPAHMEGRGVSLTGPNISIDRRTNLLSMDGAGEMQKLVDRDLENRPLPHPNMVRVAWRKGMTFDGMKARFQDEVKVRGETQVLETGWLEVHLQHPIRFAAAVADDRPQDPPQVEKLLCGEGVYIVNQSFAEGQQVSRDYIQLKDLDMNNITGDFHARGPGRVISVRRGGGQAFSLPGGPLAALGPEAGRVPARPAAFNPALPPANSRELTCLDLKFTDSITGNKNRKNLVFHGQVRAKHAAAESWATTLEEDDPNRLPTRPGLQPVRLDSESLEVADMSPVGGSGGSSMEFQALGNVVAEGTKFTARCARMSYSQIKDWLIFEGDGRSDAELYKQEAIGWQAQTFKAQKITYVLKTGDVKVDGIRSAEINETPRAPKPATGRP